MSKGQVVYSAKPEELKANDEIKSNYLGIYAALARLVAGQRHPVHDAAVAVIVVDRIVQRAAVVPERDRAGAPIEAAGELRPGLVLEQVSSAAARFLPRSCP